MKETEYRALPLSVREKFDRVPADEIDRDPRVRAAITAKRDANERCDAAAAERVELQAKIDRLVADAAGLEAKVAEIDADRTALAVLILVDGTGDDRVDRAAQDRRNDLVRRLGLVAIALAGMDRRLEAHNSGARYIGDAYAHSNANLEAVRELVRLELARKAAA